MLERLDDWDWEQAFTYADPTPVLGEQINASAFAREDVMEIIAIDDGENDGPSWIGVFRLQDGRFAYLEAGCDYTGWDCQAGGSAQVATTLEKLVRFGVGEADRRRLELRLPEEVAAVGEARTPGG